jgi:hypothetical protein
VPILAGNVLGLVVRLDNKNLGVIGNHVRRRRVHVQLAKAASEVFVLFDPQLLVAEEDHQAVHERVMHLLELLVPERIGQVDATDFRADVRGGIVYFDGLIAHVPSSLSGSVTA